MSESKKITLRIPRELYKDLMQYVILKHKSVYGHFNKECVKALTDHISTDNGAAEAQNKSKESKMKLTADMKGPTFDNLPEYVSSYKKYRSKQVYVKFALVLSGIIIIGLLVVV